MTDDEHTEAAYRFAGMQDDMDTLRARITELEKERDKWRECAEKLAEELSSMKCQYGCTCGHPACRVCGDTKCAAEALSAFDKLKGERK